MSEHNEARVVIFTRLVHPTTSIEMSPTVRGDDLGEAWKALGDFVQAKVEAGWLAAPSRDGVNALRQYKNDRAAKAKAEQPQDTVQPPVSTGAPPAPAGPPAAAPEGPPPAAAPPDTTGGVKKGTSELHSVFVNPKGQAEFVVGKFKYPFKDARGPETVAGLFDPDLGWTPADFTPGAFYDKDVTGLFVDWEKPGKYYDITRVHKGDGS